MKHDPQPLFVIRMGRYNLVMFIVYACLAAACYAARWLDGPADAKLGTALLALAIVCSVQLPFYWLAFWWKRDRDVTNFLVTIVDVGKYFLSVVKHGVTIWVLVQLIATPWSWERVGTYPALAQCAQTAYTIVAPLVICTFVKIQFCCGATKLKPGQTQEEALLEYVRTKMGKP